MGLEVPLLGDLVVAVQVVRLVETVETATLIQEAAAEVVLVIRLVIQMVVPEAPA